MAYVAAPTSGRRDDPPASARHGCDGCPPRLRRLARANGSTPTGGEGDERRPAQAHAAEGWRFRRAVAGGVLAVRLVGVAEAADPAPALACPLDPVCRRAP